MLDNSTLDHNKRPRSQSTRFVRVEDKVGEETNAVPERGGAEGLKWKRRQENDSELSDRRTFVYRVDAIEEIVFSYTYPRLDMEVCA